MKKYTFYFSILLVFFCFFLTIPYFSELNNLFVDRLHGNLPASREIVIIGIDDKTLQEVGAWPWDRSIFADFLDTINSQKPKVVAFDVLFAESRNGDDKLANTLQKINFPVIMASKFEPEEGFIESIFGRRVFNSAVINLFSDTDSKIRKFQTTFPAAGRCYPSFALAISKKYLNQNDIYSCKGEKTLSFNYSDKKFTYVSFIDVLNNKTPVDLNGKIVLIGSSITDLKNNLEDNLINVFGQKVPGVEIHANILNSILQNRFQYQIPVLPFFFASYLFFIILFILFSRLKNNWFNLGAFATVFIFSNVLGIILFEFGLNWYFVQVNFLLVFTYISYIFLRYLFENLENRFIKQAFSKYLNPTLLNDLLSHKQSLKLGGEKRIMTVMFSDIRSFTAISEKLTPEELVKMINDYLDMMSEVILSQNGTIDKYIGDAIMAFWNAPLVNVNHQQNAIQTAILMENELINFQQSHPEYPQFKIGIGINTGSMTVGNVGGRNRFDYTVLGDNVNLASRFEGLTKKYGVGILVSSSVIKNLNLKDFIFRLVDEVVVKGRTSSVKIYQPLKNTLQNSKLKDTYEKAFLLYQKGDFTKAKKLFNLFLLKNDPPSQLLIERIKLLKSNHNWSGVWSWDEK